MQCSLCTSAFLAASAPLPFQTHLYIILLVPLYICVKYFSVCVSLMHDRTCVCCASALLRCMHTRGLCQSLPASRVVLYCNGSVYYYTKATGQLLSTNSTHKHPLLRQYCLLNTATTLWTNANARTRCVSTHLPVLSALNTNALRTKKAAQFVRTKAANFSS